MKIEDITEQQKTISKKHCNKKRYGKQKTKHMKNTLQNILKHIFFPAFCFPMCLSGRFFCFVCNRSFVNPGPLFVLQKSTPLRFPTDENDEKYQIVYFFWQLYLFLRFVLLLQSCKPEICTRQELRARFCATCGQFCVIGAQFPKLVHSNTHPHTKPSVFVCFVNFFG